MIKTTVPAASYGTIRAQDAAFCAGGAALVTYK